MCRSGMSIRRVWRRADGLRSGDGQDHLEAEAGDRLTEWVARLEKFEQASATEPGSGLLVQPAWIEQHVPGIRELTVAPMVISPGKHHGTRSIDAVSSTPLAARFDARDEHDGRLHAASVAG